MDAVRPSLRPAPSSSLQVALPPDAGSWKLFRRCFLDRLYSFSRRRRTLDQQVGGSSPPRFTNSNLNPFNR